MDSLPQQPRVLSWSLKNFFRLSAGILVLGGIFIFFVQPLWALDPIEELEQQKNELTKLLKLSADATAPLEKEVQDLDNRIRKAQNGIATAKKQAQDVAKNIQEQELNLA